MLLKLHLFFTGIFLRTWVSLQKNLGPPFKESLPGSRNGVMNRTLNPRLPEEESRVPFRPSFAAKATQKLNEGDEEDGDGYSSRSGFVRRGEGKEFVRDPEFAEIMGACLDDPQKARSKMEERLRKKRNKILHTKSGSGESMKVVFNDGFVHRQINPKTCQYYSIMAHYRTLGWMQFHEHASFLSTPIQLSQSPFDKRPNYDATQGANVTPTTFYNIGYLEIQDNLGRVWVDVGTKEPLILDILINALTQISSDFVGIKQVVFGGTECEHWNEKLTSEEAGYAVHKI